MGSGTTLVEAKLLNRKSVGYDIDPLARLIADVKSTPICDDQIRVAYERVTKHLPKMGESGNGSNRIFGRPEFVNSEYWFSDDVAQSLALLADRIRNTKMPAAIRRFLWVAFTSLILAKTSVANARDIVHSRHHFWEHSSAPDVFGKFSKRVLSMRKQMLNFWSQVSKHDTEAKAILGDARNLRQTAESVDLVFTSPPYVTALDYTRSHFLAVAWLENELGLSLEQYKTRAAAYIGTERQPSVRRETKETVDEVKSLKSVLASLRAETPTQALLTERYFIDMYSVMREIKRILRPGKHAVLVVCPSHIRKIEVPSHEILMEIGNSVGLNAKKCYSRVIDARKRLLPFVKPSFGNRMSTEYVLIFRKD